MTMLTRRTALLGATATGALAACGPLAPGAIGPDANLASLMDTIARDMLRDSPELATSLAANETLAGGPYKARMSDRSTAAETARNAMVAGWIRSLEAIKPDKLSIEDRISRDVALSAARHAHAAARFGYGDAGYGAPVPYVVSQLSGAYVGTPDFLDSQHVVKDRSDADAYLARVEAYAGMIAQETARLKADAAAGVLPPDFIIDRALGQLRGSAATPTDDNVLVTSLQAKAKEAALDVTALAKSARGLVADKVTPALREQIAALEGLRGKAGSDAGVWKLPEGEAYYAAALGSWTTTAKTAEEVHRLGLDMVKSYQAQMDEGLKKLGMTQGTVGARMAALGKDPKHLYPNTDAGKTALIEDLGRQMATLETRLPEVFATLPKAKVEVRRVPAATEAGAPGGYYQPPAPDGSRPGAYYINLRDTAAWPKWSLPTLTYHEASPGHHLQIALAQEAEGLPYLRSKLLWFGAYGEGWALYAEQLADEIGMYENDVPGWLGYAQSMAFRAARCVVDTGLHAKRWSKEQAVQYMIDVTGDTRDSIVTEIERYCVWPGQATCYMVGKVELLDLRAKAKTRLGDAFDLKAFHDRVLLSGAMPLDVLDRSVEQWLAATKA
jgi:uncharacterized protein (DUF885 family)